MPLTLSICLNRAERVIHSSETWPIMKPAWTYLYYVEVQKSLIFRPGETPEPYPEIELSYSRLKASKQNKPFFFFDGRDARAVPEYINIHVSDKQT